MQLHFQADRPIPMFQVVLGLIVGQVLGLIVSQVLAIGFFFLWQNHSAGLLELLP